MGGKSKNFEQDFVRLAKVALSGREQDVQALLQRFARRYRETNEDFADSIVKLLREAPTRSSPLRKQAGVALPVDIDSRLQLLRLEADPQLDQEPVYSERVSGLLSQIVLERKKEDKLLALGLAPTRTALFVGPPGVGKTLAARWVARELERPLLVLDLAAVMSSYLGRTGTNLRHVLDYAKSENCVLLLDELDAIAKRRDDSGEVGELKRLVTVLNQEIDDWPSSGLLLAATNHAELLDPAIWRRFEVKVDFPMPSKEGALQFIGERLKGIVDRNSEWPGVLAVALSGLSYSDLDRALNSAKRTSALNGGNIDDHLLKLVALNELPKSAKVDLATRLVRQGMASQRRAHELTGVARDTIRKHLAS